MQFLHFFQNGCTEGAEKAQINMRAINNQNCSPLKPFPFLRKVPTLKLKNYLLPM